MHAENGLVDLEGMVHLPAVSPAALAATGLIMIIWPKLYLRSGIAMGPVIVELESLRDAPARETAGAGAEWEDVVEFTAKHLPGAPVEVRGASELPPPGASVPAPDVSPSGNLRVRLSAAGRAIAPDQVVSEACEQYLIQFWPVDSDDQQVISSLSNVVRRSGSVVILPPDSAWVADESRRLR